MKCHSPLPFRTLFLTFQEATVGSLTTIIHPSDLRIFMGDSHSHAGDITPRKSGILLSVDMLARVIKKTTTKTQFKCVYRLMKLKFQTYELWLPNVQRAFLGNLSPFLGSLYVDPVISQHIQSRLGVSPTNSTKAVSPCNTNLKRLVRYWGEN